MAGSVPTGTRLGGFGEGINELVCQLQPEERYALLGQGGYGFPVRLNRDALPETALLFDPEQPGRRLLRYARLTGERLA